MRWSVSLVLCLFASMPSTTILTQQASASEHEWIEYSGSLSDAETYGMRLSADEVVIFYGSQSCLGDFRGEVTDHGSYLTAVDPDPILAPECVFTITPDGENAYRIEQGMGCTAYHGAACNLSGRVEKVATFSPSFECSGTLTEVEQVICEDEELSSLDRRLAEAYENYVPTGYEVAPLPELMARWRELRDTCGTNKYCIRLIYRDWVHDLSQSIARESLSPPSIDADEDICMFRPLQEDLNGPKVYSCHDGIYDLDFPSATACHIGNNVYRLVQSEEEFETYTLQYWDSVVDFLRGNLPSDETPVSSLSSRFGQDHWGTGCTLHSCVSAEVYSQDGQHFGSPRFYFWFTPNDWDPIVYPEATMFIAQRDRLQYPDVQFCRYLND